MYKSKVQKLNIHVSLKPIENSHLFFLDLNPGWDILIFFDLWAKQALNLELETFSVKFE